jgi:hypothetical protein
MFPFIDPIIDTTEDGFSEFVTQLDAFFDFLEEKGEVKLKIRRPLTEETYREMWMLRYQHHLGNLGFLELLTKYEEILGISARSDSE